MSRRVGNDALRGHLEGMLLALLATEPGHGYALSQRLTTRSDGEFSVPEGSLYPALQRLERRRLITSAWESGTGRRRRVYRLTAAGRREVTGVREDWQRFSIAVGRVLDTAGEGA